LALSWVEYLALSWVSYFSVSLVENLAFQIYFYLGEMIGWRKEIHLEICSGLLTELDWAAGLGFHLEK